MGKNKKSKKDVDLEGDLSENEECGVKTDVKNEVKEGKKGKKSRKNKDLEEAQREMEALALGEEIEGNEEIDKETSSSKKNDKKKKKKDQVVDPDEEGENDKFSSKKKGGPAGFSLLMEDDDNDSDSPPPSPLPKKKSNKKGGFQVLAGDQDEDDAKISEEDDEKSEKVVEKEDKKKAKKKKKKKEKSPGDDDFDKMLAQFKSENVDDDGFVVVETPQNDEVKTAAQKKKEKKERQKMKKETEVEEDDADNDDQPDQVDDDDKKSKKKKKKKGATEEVKDDKKKKKPAKGTLLAMQEALKKVQEDEEKRLKEEEERIAKEEALEAERLEKKRLEEEKKAAKKERERLKKEQAKKEGKYLTAKQKQAKAQAEAMLAAMRAQGLEIPSTSGEKKAPRPGTRIRPNKKAKSATPEKEETTLIKKEEEVKIVEAPPKKEPQVEETVEENSVKDAWDASSDEEEQEQKTTEKTQEEKQQSKVQQPSEEVEESEDESKSDEDSEDESEEETSEESSSEEEGNDLNKREKAIARIEKRRAEHESNRNTDVLRSPVVCVLGHVDTGKTKILDKLRRTNVQDGEAGGITQQIGATNVPIDVVKEQCKNVNLFSELKLKLPGLLIIDTPGHESFSNLRDRGSSLCDIAILVVDIMHNLEPQTIESINLLKKKKTPFVVALNKVDRLYEWKSNRHKDIEQVVKSQQPNTKLEFEKRSKEVITALAEQGLNAALCWENPDPKTYIHVVPTSAHTGEGMGNLMALLVSLSQTMLAKRLSFSEELQATVLEVKAISGLGTTIDIVLVNGTLKEGSTIIVAGTEGPIVTQIKALLTPSKMQDLRVKVNYVEHKVLRAAQGVKIAAKELEKAIAGLNLLVANHPDEVEICKEEIQTGLDRALNAIKLKQEGVFVQASTLGSLEALLEFLRTSKIPYAGVKIGPVVKRDVMKASVMLEHEEKYTVILAFDVKVERDAQELADSMGVKIFQADIIYHLFDRFTAYQEDLKKQKREEFKHVAVFPCKLKIMPNFVFNSRDPIVAGFIVESGIVRSGTPVCVPSKEFLEIGVVSSIQNNHKEQESARKGEEVCIKIDPIPGESPKMFGRHFDENDMIVSKITRASIDACKNYFRDDLQKSDWQLMVELKKTFQIL